MPGATRTERSSEESRESEEGPVAEEERTVEASRTAAASRTATVARLEDQLDRWRRRMDETLVQLDLGSMDLRDMVRRRAATAETIFLSTRSRLRDLRHETGANFASAIAGTERLFRDLQRAHIAVEEAGRRHGSSDDSTGTVRSVRTVDGDS